MQSRASKKFWTAYSALPAPMQRRALKHIVSGWLILIIRRWISKNQPILVCSHNRQLPGDWRDDDAVRFPNRNSAIEIRKFIALPAR